MLRVLPPLLMTLFLSREFPRLPRRCFVFDDGQTLSQKKIRFFSAALAVASYDEPGRTGLTLGVYSSAISYYAGLIREGLR